MTLRILYADELRGLARSKVMIALWVGLPLLTLLVKLIQPDTEGVPLLIFAAVLVGSIGGTLSAVLLSTMITGERNRHVYDLFLTRPVRRSSLLLAKFFAALTCLFAAAVGSIALAAAVDAATGALMPGLATQLGESLLVSMAGMTIASAVGVLFGVLIESIAVSAILSVYLGNQLSAIIILPAVLVEGLNVPLFAGLVGALVPAVLMAVAIAVFKRKSL
ncbi:MAG: ABC transporter permease [Spirochaetia bacterium]